MSKNKEEGKENLEKSNSSKEKLKVQNAKITPSEYLNSLVQKLENNEKLVQKVLEKIKNLDDKIKDLSSLLEQQEKVFDQKASFESHLADYEEKIKEIVEEGILGKVETLFEKFDESLTSHLQTSKDEIVEKISKDLSLKSNDIKIGIEETIDSSIKEKIISDITQSVEGLSETITVKMLEVINNHLTPVGEKIVALSEDMDDVKSVFSGLESFQKSLEVLTEKISEVESNVGNFSSIFQDGMKKVLSTSSSFNESLSEVQSSISSEINALKDDVKNIKLAYFEKLEELLEISDSIKEFQEILSELDVENISEKIVEKVKQSLESLIEEQKALKEEFVTKITYVEEELSKGIDAESVKEVIIESVEDSLKKTEQIQEKMQSNIVEAFEKQANLATRFAKELDDLTHTIEDLKTEHVTSHSDLAEKLKSLKEAFRKLIEVLKKQGLL